MRLTYGSVCSGIEAATVAWHPLGWKPAWFSEIEPFPCAVLQHHFPEVPNLGDMTEIPKMKKEFFNAKPIDVLVGGTPCQSFSVAGLRKGMADPRGNLALVFLGIIDKARPRWVVWENVPGVLSSSGGRDFGAFLGGLAQLGYGFAYRVLDAQYFGVPQRRRRVFVVGYFGDWRPAAAVLFERSSLSGDSAPSREAGKGAAHDVAPILDASGCGFSRTGDNRGQDPVIAHTLRGDTSKWAKGTGAPAGDEAQNLIPIQSVAAVREKKQNGIGIGKPGDKMFTLTGRDQRAVAFAQNTRDEVRQISGDGKIAGALGSDEGMKQRTYIAFTSKDHGADAGETSPTLRGGGHDKSPANGGVPPAVVYDMRGNGDGKTSPTLATDHPARTSDFAPVVIEQENSKVAIPINTQLGTRGAETSNSAREGVGIGEPGDPAFTLQSAHSHGLMTPSMSVRRLTPRECERLQGFPDDYTLIPYRGGAAKDGPRYKSLGNSMAVPVMSWIGQRIEMVEKIFCPQTSKRMNVSK